MANDNPLFCFSPFNFDHEIQEHHQTMESILKEDDQLLGFYQHVNHKAGSDLISGYFLDDQQQQKQPSIFDDFDVNSIFSPAQSIPFQDITANSTKKFQSNSSKSPFASVELLNIHRSGSNRLTNVDENKVAGGESSTQLGHKISTEGILRIAGARYIQFSGQMDIIPTDHPFGYALSGLSKYETKAVELIHLLLSAAEKVGFRQFDRAKTLLRNCETVASSRANPIERLALYFTQALRDRVEKESGIRAKRVTVTEISQGLSSNLTTLTYQQRVPFLQVTQFPAVQTLIEAFESATKLHLIDLEIRSGIQWTGLIQSLATREGKPVEVFRITAVGRSTATEKIDETRKRLASLAESLGLPFVFRAVLVSDMEEIGEEMFENDRENDEVVVVHSLMLLRTMICRPRSLESLMRVIRHLKPALMTVVEVEADLNFPNFSQRFIEALFFYGAFFDCFKACLGQHDDYDDNNGQDFRTTMEGLLGVGIRNIVASEGVDRVNRSVRVRVWRDFFARYGMVEIEMSESCYYQASLVAKQFGCGGSCTLDRDGKSLVVGWKGTPIHSLSAWKFI